MRLMFFNVSTHFQVYFDDFQRFTGLKCNGCMGFHEFSPLREIGHRIQIAMSNENSKLPIGRPSIPAQWLLSQSSCTIGQGW